MLARAAALRTRYDRPASKPEKEAALATDAAQREAWDRAPCSEQGAVDSDANKMAVAT